MRVPCTNNTQSDHSTSFVWFLLLSVIHSRTLWWGSGVKYFIKVQILRHHCFTWTKRKVQTAAERTGLQLQTHREASTDSAVTSQRPRDVTRPWRIGSGGKWRGILQSGSYAVQAGSQWECEKGFTWSDKLVWISGRWSGFSTKTSRHYSPTHINLKMPFSIREYKLLYVVSQS